MYLLSSFLTLVCFLVVSRSFEKVAEPVLESAVVIVMVGHFFPNWVHNNLNRNKNFISGLHV